jgi:hypothetical protein
MTWLIRSSLVSLLLFTFAHISFLEAQQTIPPTQSVAIAKNATISLPANWQANESRQSNVLEIFERKALPDKEGEFLQSRITVVTEDRSSFADALKRLAGIAAEVPSSPPTFLTISGWPALIRHYSVLLEQPGMEHRDQEESAAGGERPLTQRVTIAIAAGSQLFRVEAVLAPGADPKLAAEAETIGRGLKVPPPPASQRTEILNSLKTLRAQFVSSQPEAERNRKTVLARVRPPPVLQGPWTGVDTQGGGPTPPTTPVLVHETSGELELAVSNDGRTVVVATNSGYSYSHDAGQTFTRGGPTPASFPHDGDPSLALGATPTFYYAFLGRPDGSAAANNVTGCSVSVAVSADTGNTFTFRNHAVFCANGKSTCGPDQEHLAADHLNAAKTGDQLYVVWRNFTPAQAASTLVCTNLGANYVAPSIVCSVDGGQNWTAPKSLGTGDFPRVTVGQDGFVYVIFRENSNVVLDKFSSCENGLAVQQGWPVTVASINDVTCPEPGLDRCNDGNTLSSQMAAVATDDPTHVFVAYATNDGVGEDIVVRDSVDGGLTFPRQVIINSGSESSHRFMPWVCPVDDAAFVSWYDRRKASQVTSTNQECETGCQKTHSDCLKSGIPAWECGQGLSNCTNKCKTLSNNDLTEYFYAFARPVGGSLQTFGETDLSGRPDPQCASGWPDGARSAQDYLSCSVQPQTASVGGGEPKYGDYNGNACASSHAYFAWASATAPIGLPAVSGMNVFFAATPSPATLTIRKILSPADTLAHFFLTLDGVARTGAVANDGSTGPLTVLPGPHVVGELNAGDASQFNFSGSIGGDCAFDGSITLNPGDNKTCTITNTREAKTTCLNNCEKFHSSCMASVGQPGGKTAAQCSMEYNQCKQRCGP